MTATQIWLTDPNTGDFVALLPMALSGPYTRLINGTGALSGAVPMDAPSLAGIGVIEHYEITVLEDEGSGFLPDWNGPITNLDIDVENRVYNITAQEISALFTKRTVEVDRDYSGWDRYDIIRDLVSVMTTKTATAGDEMTGGAGTDINAAIPRFSVSPSSGASGYTIDDGDVPPERRYLVSDVFARVVNDPDNPIDWKIDYRTGSTSTSCHRTLVLGAPLGTTITTPITNSDVFLPTKTMDRLRAANRIHVIGAAETYTLQNASDILVNDDVLLEAVFDKSEVTDRAGLHQFAREARTVSYPPITTHTFMFAEGWGALAPGFCNVGDNININLSDGSLTSIGYRRVTQIGKLPGTPDNPRQFIVDISIPLDTLS